MSVSVAISNRQLATLFFKEVSNDDPDMVSDGMVKFAKDWFSKNQKTYYSDDDLDRMLRSFNGRD